MKTTFVTRPTASIAVLALLLCAAGCGAGGGSAGSPSAGGTQGVSISRATIYDSLAALAAASDAVIVGTVTDQKVATDIDDTTQFTLSTMEVRDTIKGSVGSDVVVRQTGSEQQSAGGKYMAVGGTYLVYVVESGLDGDLASQYYVTGVDAGIYAAPDGTEDSDLASDDAIGDLTFTRLNADSGDDLPATVTVSAALG